MVSLLRQWLLRSGSWKLAAAVIGGLVEVVAGGLGGLMFMRGQMTAHLAAAPLRPPPNPAEVLASNNLIYVVMWVATGVVLMVVALVCWVRSLNGRRLERLSAGPREARPAWSRR